VWAFPFPISLSALSMQMQVGLWCIFKLPLKQAGVGVSALLL
jgi:hypothetical protein